MNRNPKGYAYGGEVEPDEPNPFDIAVNNSTATAPSVGAALPPAMPMPQLTMADLAPRPILPDLGATPMPAPPAAAGPPPQVAPSPDLSGARGALPAPGAPPAPGTPPPSLADILAAGDKASQSAYGAYGPDKRQELVRYMLDKQNSLPNAIGQSLSGLGDAIVRGSGRDSNFLENSIKQGQDTVAKATGNFDEAQKQKKQATETGLSLEQMDPTSPMSKSAQTAARPMLAAAGLTDAQIANLPASAIDGALKSATSFADAKAKLAQVAAMREATAGVKRDTAQDRLENQAINRIAGVRGDQSLKDAESKRDASITVYNTIENLKREGRMPSKLEYYDLLGQMWKARTGATPTDQAIKDLDTKTFKGDLNRASSYFSGKPGGATTGGVLQNIQDFAKESGKQADEFHDSYMKPHLVKPTGLDDERWQPILNSGRGRSFADATKSVAPDFAPDVMAYAAKHGITPDQAQQIKTQRTGVR